MVDIRNKILENLHNDDWSIPYSSSWSINFDIPSGVWLPPSGVWLPPNWGGNDKQSRLINTLIAKNKTEDNITYFVKTVEIPTEKTSISKIGPTGEHGGHLLKGNIMTSRNDLGPVGIHFYETSTTILDYIIKPWSINISKWGLIPRSNPLTTTLVITYYDRKKRARKTYTYYNAFPTGTDQQYITSQDNNEITSIKTGWLYSDYAIDANKNNSGIENPIEVFDEQDYLNK